MEQSDTKRTGTDAGCPVGGEAVYIMLGELRSERDEDEHGQQRHVLGMNDVSSSEASNLDQLWVTILLSMALGVLRIIFVVFHCRQLCSYLTNMMRPVKPLELFRQHSAVAVIQKLIHVSLDPKADLLL